MSDVFLGEIRAFAFNFNPVGWALCNGALLPISQNTALFSLLGTTYGGNGTSTFALPNMQGMAPMHPGTGAGLSLHDLGETSGVESVTLLTTEMPSHTHALAANTGLGNRLVASGNVLSRVTGATPYVPQSSSPSLTSMSASTLSATGGGQPHNNMMPYLTLNFCIAIQGIYPSR